MAIDMIARAMAMGAGSGGDLSDYYTKTEVNTALSGKADTSSLGAAASKGFDAAPTSGSTNNAVSSGGVYTALAVKADKSAAFMYRGQISGTTFAANVTPGFYSYSGNPTDGAWYGTAANDFGVMECYNCGTYILQRQTSFEKGATAWRRSANGGTSFTSWYIMANQQ